MTGNGKRFPGPAAARWRRKAMALAPTLARSLLLVLLLVMPALPAQAQEAEVGATGVEEPAVEAPVQVWPADAAATGEALANNDDEVVYVDGSGFIRVYDPAGSPAVQWVSPDAGWNRVTLGDFNGDGDDEIVAIGGEGSARRLTIYDPVVTSGEVDATQQYNGIPWRTLYTTPLAGAPQLVGVGEFDTGMPGQEIVYTIGIPSQSRPGATRSEVVILTQTSAAAQGTSWRELTTSASEALWSDLAAGDLTANGIDDLALVDEDGGLLEVYRLVNGGLVRYFEDQSDARPWSGAAIGAVDPDTAQPELVLVRLADRPLPSLVVWRWDAKQGKFVDVYLRDLNPAPRVVWLADITGSGDFEMYLLRNVKRTTTCPAPYNTPPFQLLMRNRGADRPPNFDICLDQANTFRYGAGGDLDGDGKDEVAVISATQLRIFDNLDASPFTVKNVTVSSNAQTIAIGNLDASGHAAIDTLTANPTRLAFTVASGAQSATQAVVIDNLAGATPIPLVIATATAAPYLRWSLSNSGTPATLSVTVDASNLLPGLTYGTDILIAAGRSNVTNSPLKLPVLVTVTNGMIVRPGGLNIVRADCAAAETALPVDLRVLGTPGMVFSATVRNALAGQAEAGPAEAGPAEVAPAEVAATEVVTWTVAPDVPWITAATSPTTTVPSTLTLSLDLTKAGTFNEATVAVNGVSAGVSYPRNASIVVVCTPNLTYLPVMKK